MFIAFSCCVSALKLGVHTDCSQLGVILSCTREEGKVLHIWIAGDKGVLFTDLSSHILWKENRESIATQESFLVQHARQKICPEEKNQGGGVERLLAGCSSAEEEWQSGSKYNKTGAKESTFLLHLWDSRECLPRTDSWTQKWTQDLIRSCRILFPSILADVQVLLC